MVLDDEFLNTFLNKFSEILTFCYENYTKNSEFLKQNIKEVIILTDNLCENMISTNNTNFNLLDKMAKIFFTFNEKLQSDNFAVREIDLFLLNLVYLYTKYQNFFTNNNEISVVVDDINSYINMQLETILKSEDFRINNDKFEVIYLMKLIFNILYSKLKNLNIKTFVLENSNNVILNRLEHLDILSLTNQSIDNIDSSNIVKNVVNSLEELKILIKLIYILDKHKNSIYTLNIITTKNIESKMIEIQKIILFENKHKYMLLFIKIITIFVKNFYHFQYIETSYEDKSLNSITDEIGNLIKILLDDKIFEDKLFSELPNCIEKYELIEFPFEKDENSKIYVKFLLEYFKIFEKLVISSFHDFDTKNKVMNNFVHFFHCIMIKIFYLRNNTYKDKYLLALKDCIIKQFNNKHIEPQIINFLISFIEEKVIYIDDNINLMKNIKILREFIKFYCIKEIKINYISILESLYGKKDIDINMIILIFLRLIDTEEDYQTLNKYLLCNEDLFKKFLYFDKKLCNFWLRNTFTNENEILKKIKSNLLISSLSKRDFFEYFFKVFEEIGMETTKIQLDTHIYKFVKFYDKLLKINKDQKYSSYSTQFDQIVNQLNKIRSLNLDNIVLNDTLVIFLLNKLSFLFNDNKVDLKSRLFDNIEK